MQSGQCTRLKLCLQGEFILCTHSALLSYLLQKLPDDTDLIIGEARSGCSMAIAEATKHKNIPQISYASTSAQLSDKDAYPNFFRTCASDIYQGQALAKLVQRYKWSQVSTITTIDSYSEDLARMFAVEVRQVGVDITTEQRFEAHTKASIQEHLKEVRSSNPSTYCNN